MGEYLLLFQKTQAQFLATVFNSNAKGVSIYTQLKITWFLKNQL